MQHAVVPHITHGTSTPLALQPAGNIDAKRSTGKQVEGVGDGTEPSAETGRRLEIE